MLKHGCANAVRFLAIWVVFVLLALDVAAAWPKMYRAAVVPRPDSTDTASGSRSGPASSPRPAKNESPQAPARVTPPIAPSSGRQDKTLSGGKRGASSRRETGARSSEKRGTASKKAADDSTPSKARKDIHLDVKSALLINLSTGEVYYEQNPDKAMAPASLTKLLTLYLVREALAAGHVKLSSRIPISANALRAGGSRMNLRKGEKVSLEELLRGISIVSANNACVAVAEFLGRGDAGRFVRRMNTKAKKLGMEKSVFKNPNGLPAPGQVSTARDMAALSMKYLRAFPESLRMHAVKTHTFNGVTHSNANSLLGSYKGADGLKTGFVCASGYSITATAKRGKTRLLAVVLGARTAAIRQKETARLLDYGFVRVERERARTKARVGKRS